jgi:tripartite-type tricarboxylate transporter receptor subunit TctC
MPFATIRKLALVPALLLALAAPAGAQAPAWPARPVTLVVPYAPGGVLDGLIRPLAQRLSESLGKPFVVENRAGANTAIGTGVCARGEPNGYTFCATGSSVWTNALLQKALPYDPAKDLAPVTNLVFADGHIVANASVPFDNLKGMVAYAKANPGKLNFGSFGEGSTAHMFMEYIKDRAGIDIVHVPYKGAAPVIQATLANEVQMTYMSTGAVLQHIKSGRMKAIVAPAPQRSPFLPQVPTLAEEGFELKPSAWFGLFAAAGTPKPIVDRMQAEVRKILHDPAFREQVLNPQFYTAVGNTPEEFAEFGRQEREIAATLVKASRLKPE